MRAIASCESLPKINRQRASCSWLKSPIVKGLQNRTRSVRAGSLPLFPSALLDHSAGHVGVQLPALAQVFRDLPLFPRPEGPERPAEKDQRRRNCSSSSEQIYSASCSHGAAAPAGLAIPLRRLRTSRAQIGRHPGREPRRLPGPALVLHQPPLQQDRTGEAGKRRIAVVRIRESSQLIHP